jgi:diguanylate cyclase (GGDEF)-like protein
MERHSDQRIFSKKRPILAIAIVFCLASTACPADSASLTTLHAVRALTNDQARAAQSVDFEATVVYSRGYENLLFVQDGNDGIFVRPPTSSTLTPGDRILVRGTMQASFHPLVVGSTVTLLHHGALPKPMRSTFAELIRAQYDSMLVTIPATVRAADLIMSTSAPVGSTRLQLLAESGHFEANLDSTDETAIKDLLDAEVEVTGVAAGKFDNKMQQTGVILYASSLANIKVVKRASASPWSLPVKPMDQILLDYHMRDLTPRVHVQGTITYYQPGSAIVLQNGSKSLWIETKFREPLQIGNRADATGFPDAHNRILTLTDAEIQDSHIFEPVTPPLATWRQLGFWSSNRPDGHQNDLVSIEGQVVTEVREATQDAYVLTADGRMFTAIYRHPRSAGVLPQMLRVPLGSRIRVTGICAVMDVNSINPGEEVPFNILLRSFDDITVIAKPSWLNIGNLIRLTGVLLLIVIAVAAWGTVLNLKVRRQTAAMAKRIASEAAYERRIAQLEHKRSRILEDINGSRPLAEILEEIAELVSFALNDAPCWCEVTNGARLGDFRPLAVGLRVVRTEIPSRSGPPLGALYVALDSSAMPATPAASAHENEALSVGAKLATLAIETRRLYTDLLHRSEFDQLTDVHNRFSLGKRLDAQIEDSRQSAGIFGLIYIDLDGFKQVNDIFGHHVGDLYLQEAARRMKKQLRSHDLLARLGGDEFAVLLPMVRNRAGVEEIALRLEHCFFDPFVLEGHTLQGSASFGVALYPEDGTARESLLNTADTAMYKAKNSRKQTAHEEDEREHTVSPDGSLV